MRYLIALILVGCSGSAASSSGEEPPPEVESVVAVSAHDGGPTSVVVEESGPLPDAGTPAVVVDSGTPDTWTPPVVQDSGTPPKDSGTPDVWNPGSGFKCGVGAYATPVYTQYCGNPRTTSDPNVTYIEWKDANDIWATCGGPCVFGTTCRVHYANGTYNSGRCL